MVSLFMQKVLATLISYQNLIFNDFHRNLKPSMKNRPVRRKKIEHRQNQRIDELILLLHSFKLLIRYYN